MRLIKTNLVVCVIVILCVSFIPAHAQTADPMFEPAACQFEIPSGQDVECGYLTVPEDRSQPDGPTIRLHVAVFASHSPSPESDPVVYLSGGPGSNALETVPLAFNQRFDAFLDDRDFIILDQRGAGYSEPALDCPELTDLTYDLLDEDPTIEEEIARTLDAFTICRERLIDDGVNLSAYTSAENAADLADLREALGYDEWNLYGISYGTRLALTIMRDHPAGIRSVVLDSSYPLEVSLYEALAANTDRAFTTLFEGCAAHEGCSEAYGDLYDQFYGLVDQFNQDPVTIPVTQPFDGQTYEMHTNGDILIDFLFQSLYATEVIPLLPKIINDMAAEDYSVFGRLMGAYLAEQEYLSAGMLYSVRCGEEVSFDDPEVLAHMTDDFPELHDYFTRNLWDQTVFTICDLWDVAEADPIENEPVSSDIPTLVMAGEYDPITPPEWGQLVATNLSQSFFYEFPGVGHGASLAGECPLDVMMDFLDDPQNEPDVSCISEMSGPAFALPIESIELVPFTNDEAGFTTVLPEGWSEIAPGVYAESMSSTTAVVFQSVPGVDSETLFNALKTGFETEEPIEVADTREANGLTWTLYNFVLQGSEVDLGVTDNAQGSFMILMISSPSDREALYEGLFLPAIDAYVPLD